MSSEILRDYKVQSKTQVVQKAQSLGERNKHFFVVVVGLTYKSLPNWVYRQTCKTPNVAQGQGHRNFGELSTVSLLQSLIFMSLIV